MLVLSRKLNERIFIGQGDNMIVLTVVAIRGDKIRLGVEAPVEIPVDREEIFEAKLRDQRREDERRGW